MKIEERYEFCGDGMHLRVRRPSRSVARGASWSVIAPSHPRLSQGRGCFDASLSVPR